MVKPWETSASEVVQEYRIFRLRKDRCRSPRTGVEHDFFVLEMPEWCNVVALTPDEHVVLVRQYRFGIRDMALEIPGGLVEPGEDPVAAARRELLEETGYSADRVEIVGRTHPNPAIQNNVCYTALATGCRRTHTPSLDAREDIDVELRPLAEIEGLVAAGEITHALVIVAFHHFETSKRGLSALPRGRAPS